MSYNVLINENEESFTLRCVESFAFGNPGDEFTFQKTPKVVAEEGLQIAFNSPNGEWFFLSPSPENYGITIELGEEFPGATPEETAVIRGFRMKKGSSTN